MKAQWKERLEKRLKLEQHADSMRIRKNFSNFPFHLISSYILFALSTSVGIERYFYCWLHSLEALKTLRKKRKTVFENISISKHFPDYHIFVSRPWWHGRNKGITLRTQWTFIDPFGVQSSKWIGNNLVTQLGSQFIAWLEIVSVRKIVRLIFFRKSISLSKWRFVCEY